MVHFHHVSETFLEVFVLRRPSQERAYAFQRGSHFEAAIFDRHPHVVFVGRITSERFTELCTWIDQNCDGMVIHNFRDDQGPWYTGFGFHDLTAATAFKMLWGVSRNLPDLDLT